MLFYAFLNFIGICQMITSEHRDISLPCPQLNKGINVLVYYNIMLQALFRELLYSAYNALCLAVHTIKHTLSVAQNTSVHVCVCV